LLTSNSKFQSDLDNFKKLHDLVKQNYVNNQPRYISDPGTSHICVISYADYKFMPIKAVQFFHRAYHLAITGFPTKQVVETDQVNFDKAGLQLLTNLEAPIEFQGKLSQSLSLDNIVTHHSAFTFRPVDPSWR